MSDWLSVIVATAADLKRAAPVQYESFVKSVRSYADKAKIDLLSAEPASIFVAQGQAQVLEQLAKKLENCTQLEEQHRKRT